jgi:hypothetical protein
MRTRLAAIAFVGVLLSSVSSARGQAGWPVGGAAGFPDARAGSTLQDERGHRASAVAGYEASAVPAPSSLVPSAWQALGPFGGDIEDVQVSPVDANLVLAALAPSAGGGSLYRSTSGGASWSQVATLAGKACYDIAFAPDGTAYVATIDSVWKSVNGGASFTALNLGIGLNDQVFEVDVDPADPLRLWCGVADALGTQTVNVMLSVNGGTSWSNKTPPLPAPLSCTGIAIDPANTQHVFACFAGAFGGGKVWVTANGGTTWVNRSPGLPNNPMKDIVFDGARVLLGGGQLFGSQSVGLYSTIDDGVTWIPLHDGTWPVLVVNDIGLDPNDSDVILVGSAGKGVFRSEDDGLSWAFQVGGTGSLSVNAVSFAPGSSSTLFLGSSSNAVWKSTDAAASFGASSNGIGALDVFAVGSNPHDEREIAIAFQGQNDGGVYTTLDGGQSWTLEALPSTRFSSVRFTPAGDLYAISSGPSSIAPEGLYHRTGTGWTSIGPDQGTLFESDLATMRFSRNDPDLIWAAGADFGVAGAEPTIWRTTTGGQPWTKVYEGALASRFVRDLHVVDPAADNPLIAAFVDQTGGTAGGALRSIDTGASWVPASTGLAAAVQCTSLSSPAVNPGVVYVSSSLAGGPGVYRSIDAGQTWTATGFVGEALQVVADPYVADTLYISQSSGSKVQASTNGGVSFAPYGTGLTSAGFLRDLRSSLGPGTQLLLASTTGAYGTGIAFAPPWTNLGFALAGAIGLPGLAGNGTLVAGSPGMLGLINAAPSAPAVLLVSLTSSAFPFKGGTVVTVPVALAVSLATSSTGVLTLPFTWPAAIPPATSLFFQYAILDAGGPQGASLSNAVKAVTP